MTDLLSQREEFIKLQTENAVKCLKWSIASLDWERGFVFHACELIELLQRKKDLCPITKEDRLELVTTLWDYLTSESDLSSNFKVAKKAVKLLSFLLKKKEN